MVVLNRAGFAAAALAVAAGTLPASAQEVRRMKVFVSGRGGYHTYRIPAVVRTPKGTVLAFCEGRKGGRGDAGDIDIVLRRSTDGGKTFSDRQVVW